MSLPLLSNGDVIRLRDVFIIGIDEGGYEVNITCGDEMYITADMREGVEQIQRNGAGVVVVQYKTPDVFARIQLVAARETRVAFCEVCNGDGHLMAADHIYDPDRCRDEELCPVCKGEGARV